MSYAIMRSKKIASLPSVASAIRHACRQRDTPNADPAMTPSNEHYGASTVDEAMDKLRFMLPAKRRKDAVLAVEYVMTASPEWWRTADRKKQAEFFSQARAWLVDKYGVNRIIVATVHRDETSPHLSAFVVPLTKDGRLSAKEFIGDRNKMRADQSSFAACVQHLGLERGIEGSKAKHQSIQGFYGAIERRTVEPTITADDIQPRVLRRGLLTKEIESPETVAQRLTSAVRSAYAPALAKASEGDIERVRKEQFQRTAQEKARKLEQAEQLNKAIFSGLSRAQVENLLQQAASMRSANLERQRLENEHIEREKKLARNRNTNRGMER